MIGAKLQPFFVNAASAGREEGGKCETTNPTSRRGSLHTALRKAKRHAGCQTQMYFFSPCRCKNIVFSANRTLSARKHSTFAVALIPYKSRNSSGFTPITQLSLTSSPIYKSRNSNGFTPSK